jgi:pantetheine-phosphate adenylyltransferase
MQWHRGLVALSADPITFGHLDLIDQACTHCESVIVLVTVNLEKEGRYLFSLEERGEMTAHVVLEHFGHTAAGRIRVICGRYRVVDIYDALECDILLRGLRNEEERLYEASVIASFMKERPGLSHILLPARQALAHVSSTEAKRASAHGVEQALIHVPRFVAERLAKRLRSNGGTEC